MVLVGYLLSSTLLADPLKQSGTIEMKQSQELEITGITWHFTSEKEDSSYLEGSDCSLNRG
jgi:hypothetical protein